MVQHKYNLRFSFFRAFIVKALTWDLLGPRDHVDQLLVGHAGEQRHHADLRVRPVHLLPRGQHGRLRPLQDQEHLDQWGSSDEAIEDQATPPLLLPLLSERL